ncbi:FUSC family protein [Trebonia sp.]|uniref:FUSC family protein n=1 Tax=Trebonia sp. TaxID=2767075 RepID=UPI00260D5B0A|nr:FUSC family protein [Trebonia sp.]
MPPRPHPTKAQTLAAIRESIVLAVSCMLAYWLVTTLVPRVHAASQAANLIGGLWAVIATIAVLRESYRQSVTAAVSRTSATLLSFALCLVYLLFLPFHLWALAVLIGASALAAALIGRPGDAIAAAIATSVVMVSAAITPQHAWQAPIVRLADTVVGVAVGILAAWVDMRLIRRWLPAPHLPAPLPIAFGDRSRLVRVPPRKSSEWARPAPLPPRARARYAGLR